MAGSINLADTGGTPQTLTGDMVKELLGIQKEQLATAWVYFDGTTGAIISSYNVSSVTRTATGKFAINFAAAMDNADFIPQINIRSTVSSTVAFLGNVDADTVPTTSSCNIITYWVNAANNRTYADKFTYVTFHGGKA